MAGIRISDSMSEADLQSAVLALCRWMKLRAYHTHDSRRSEPGFPDLVIAGPKGHLFRELKTAGGKVSKPQHEWAQALQASADVAVWRPADWLSGRIQHELEAIA